MNELKVTTQLVGSRSKHGVLMIGTQWYVGVCVVGLFLNVGYSVAERHVIERKSSIRLDSHVMLHKLAALLQQSANNSQAGQPVSRNSIGYHHHHYLP